MILADVFVPGTAKTKGSMAVRNGRTGTMKDSVIGSSTWRALVAAQVRDDVAGRPVCNCGGEDCAQYPYDGPVHVTIDIALPEPPVTSPGTIRRALFDRWGWPVWAQSGDVDKLARNVLDAIGALSENAKMNGGAIVDDVLVCELSIRKRVASARYPVGARVTIETLPAVWPS